MPKVCSIKERLESGELRTVKIARWLD